MYLVPIAWIYVVLMMSVAEATNSNGSVLGAVFTFLIYGAAPVALILYFMGTPARKRALRAQEAAERAAAIAVPLFGAGPCPCCSPPQRRSRSCSCGFPP